jgi:hypothetical protein
MASVSGVIGTDLLATMTRRLSYSAGTAQIIADIGDNASRVALLKMQSRYFVPVRIGSSTFQVLLDSGTNLTALSSPVWAKTCRRPGSRTA